mmetsp:Transcript_64655/g.135652  ORF Transcript_64655/g.135652 Transcript_64655/m.135652 type:complete len:475 (+) Transcript_64655:1-1425(+)
MEAPTIRSGGTLPDRSHDAPPVPKLDLRDHADARPVSLDQTNEERRSVSATTKCIGTWHYGANRRYCLTRGPMPSTLRFDEQNSSGRWVTGELTLAGNDQFEGQVMMRDSNNVFGTVRVRYVPERDTVISNFLGTQGDPWGPDTVASKVDPNERNPSRTSGGQDSTNHKKLDPKFATTKLIGQWDAPCEAAANTNWIDDHEGGTQPPSNSGFLGGFLGMFSSKKDRSHEGEDWKIEPPIVLRVKCPEEQGACGGDYDLLIGRNANGHPIWRSRDGTRWIYTGVDGKWYIGGPASAERDFDCAAGFLFRDFLHKGVMPHLVGGPWEFGDGRSWHPNADIVIAVPPENLSGHGEQPGRYVVIHDNTAVTKGVNPEPPVVGRLAFGAEIQILELVHRSDQNRVRGRVENPAGWISLWDTKDGYRWAVPSVELRQGQRSRLSSGASRMDTNASAKQSSTGSVPTNSRPLAGPGLAANI